jgi:hypothetical protein
MIVVMLPMYKSVELAGMPGVAGVIFARTSITATAGTHRRGFAAEKDPGSWSGEIDRSRISARVVLYYKVTISR